MILCACHQWMAARVVVFPRINNVIGMGKLHLRDGTTKVFIFGLGERRFCYLGWRSSRLESSCIVDSINRSRQNRYKGHVLCFGKSQHGVKRFLEEG